MLWLTDEQHAGRQRQDHVRPQISCSVGVEEDAPVLHVFESLRAHGPNEAPADLRCYRIDTVDEVVQGRRSPRAGMSVKRLHFATFCDSIP